MSIDVAKQIYQMSFTDINDFVDLQKLQTEPAYKYNLPRFNIHHDSAEEVFFVINGFHKALGY